MKERNHWINKLTALLIVFLLMLACAPPEAAFCADEAQLLKGVILCRHGVRSPTMSAEELASWSKKSWPAWPVKRGELTARGSALVFQQWDEMRGHLDALGVKPNEVFICADAMQRTRATASSIAQALAPDGNIAPPLSDKEAVTPLFHPVKSGLTVLNKDLAYKDIIADAGGSLAALKQKLSPELAVLAQICGPLPQKSCEKYNLPKDANFLALPSEVSFGADGLSAKLTGGIEAASSIAEIFLLEYCQFPDKNSGWGMVNAEVLENILPVHTVIFDTVNRAPAVATAKAGPLAHFMVTTLLSAVADKNISSVVSVPARASKVCVLVGHDTNIAGVGELLGLTWQLPGFSANEIPPGSALGLFLWQRGDKRFVTAIFSGLSLAAMHSSLQPNDTVNRNHLSLAHPIRQKGGSAFECPAEDFAALTQSLKPSFAK